MRYLIMLLLMAGTVFSQVSYRRIETPKVDSVRWASGDHNLLWAYIGYDVECKKKCLTFAPPYQNLVGYDKKSFATSTLTGTLNDYWVDSMWYHLDTTKLIQGTGDSIWFTCTTRVNIVIGYGYGNSMPWSFKGGWVSVDIDRFALSTGTMATNPNSSQDSFRIWVDTPQNTASEVHNITPTTQKTLKPVTYDIMGRRIADATKVGAGVYYVWDGRTCKRYLKVR
jgi:hypothetical protein